MKFITAALTCGLWTLCACKGRSDHAKNGQDNGLAFSVDTAQLLRMDSAKAAQRQSDSILLEKASSTPGINAGAGHFYISIPRGWRRVDTLLGQIRAVILDTASSFTGFRTNLSIVSDSMRGMSIDNYLAGTISSLSQYVPQFSLIGKGERTVGSRSSRWLHYSQDPGGMGLENLCYIIPDRGIAYIVTCSALKGRLLINRPAFEQAITSFTVSNP
jgi:hypothetical protein